MDCKCIEFVTAGCCTRKWFRFDQTITNLTSGGLGIPLVLIRLRLPTCAYLIRLFDGRKENMTSACGASSDDWGNGGHGSGNEVDSRTFLDKVVNISDGAPLRKQRTVSTR